MSRHRISLAVSSPCLESRARARSKNAARVCACSRLVLIVARSKLVPSKEALVGSLSLGVGVDSRIGAVRLQALAFRFCPARRDVSSINSEVAKHVCIQVQRNRDIATVEDIKQERARHGVTCRVWLAEHAFDVCSP